MNFRRKEPVVILRKTILGLLAFMILVGGRAYSQGLYWEQTVTTSMTGKTHEMHTKGYLKPMKLKTVSDETLVAYLMQHESYSGIMVARPTLSLEEARPGEPH